jgi:hypothetical protein
MGWSVIALFLALSLVVGHLYLLELQRFYRCGAQGMGGFLMVGYHKSSAAHTLRTAGVGEWCN